MERKPGFNGRPSTTLTSPHPQKSTRFASDAKRNQSPSSAFRPWLSRLTSSHLALMSRSGSASSFNSYTRQPHVLQLQVRCPAHADLTGVLVLHGCGSGHRSAAAAVFCCLRASQIDIETLSVKIRTRTCAPAVGAPMLACCSVALYVADVPVNGLAKRVMHLARLDRSTPQSPGADGVVGAFHARHVRALAARHSGAMTGTRLALVR